MVWLQQATCIVLATMAPQSLVAEKQADAPMQTFEVVSLKLHSGSDRASYSYYLRPGFVRQTNSTVLDYIMFAYDVKRYQVEGGPAWLGTTRFDLSAKEDETFVAAAKHMTPELQIDSIKAMYRSMLKSRFGFTFVVKSEVRNAYRLDVAKSGLRLKRSDIDKKTQESGTSQAAGVLEIRNMPVKALAEALSGEVGRPVVDKTGLSGSYTTKLQWRPLDSAEGDSSPVNNESSSLFAALEEQAGLRLAAAHLPIDILYITHVEQPSPN